MIFSTFLAFAFVTFSFCQPEHLLNQQDSVPVETYQHEAAPSQHTQAPAVPVAPMPTSPVANEYIFTKSISIPLSQPNHHVIPSTCCGQQVTIPCCSPPVQQPCCQQPMNFNFNTLKNLGSAIISPFTVPFTVGSKVGAAGAAIPAAASIGSGIASGAVAAPVVLGSLSAPGIASGKSALFHSLPLLIGKLISSKARTGFDMKLNVLKSLTGSKTSPCCLNGGTPAPTNCCGQQLAASSTYDVFIHENGTRVKRQVKKLDLIKALRLVEMIGLRECVAKVFCEVSCNPSHFKEAGEKLFAELHRMSKNKKLMDDPRIEFYRKAGEFGLSLRNEDNCPSCQSTYSTCTKSTSTLLPFCNSIKLDL